MTDPTNVRTDGGEEPTHRVVGKPWRYGSETYEPGDLVAPPEGALEIHGSRFEPLRDQPEPEPEPEPEPGPRMFSVAEATNDEVRDYVETVDDADELKAMLAAERDGQNRAGAVEAIEDRLAEVSG